MTEKFTIAVSDLRKMFWKHAGRDEDRFPGPPPWLHELMNDRFYTFELPTEFVIYPKEDESHGRKWGEPLAPRTGRVYRTHCYLYNGELMDRQEMYNKAGLAKKKNWSVNDICDEIVLAEVWENEGSDGHIDYAWRGWVAIPSNELRVREGDKPYNQAMYRIISERVWEDEERRRKEEKE